MTADWNGRETTLLNWSAGRNGTAVLASGVQFIVAAVPGAPPTGGFFATNPYWVEVTRLEVNIVVATGGTPGVTFDVDVDHHTPTPSNSSIIAYSSGVLNPAGTTYNDSTAATGSNRFVEHTGSQADWIVVTGGCSGAGPVIAGNIKLMGRVYWR
jgi:hypothetical protein